MAIPISISDVAQGYWRISLYWPTGIGIRFKLTLTDPDGDIDERWHEWLATANTPLADALQQIVGDLNALPHWRSSRTGSLLEIIPASDDYTGEVEITLFED